MPNPILALSPASGSGDARTVGYRFTRDPNATDAVLALEVGTTGNFTAIAATPSVTPLAGTVEARNFIDDSATGVSAARAARLVLNLAGENQPRVSESFGTRAFSARPTSGASPVSTSASAPLA